MEPSRAKANPFKKKQQRSRVLLMTLAAASLLVISGGFYLYLRSQETGILILDSNKNLVVSLNGRQVQTQTQSRGIFIPVYSGTYRLQIDKVNYQPFITDVTTEPGDVAEVRPVFTLVPSIKEAVGDAVDFVQPSFDEKYVYYLGDFRQRLFRYDVAAQQSTPLTIQPLSGVRDVQWGGNPEVALIVQADGTYLHEVPTFDFKNQIFAKVVGQEVVSPVWDPMNSERLAAAYITPGGERSLITSDKRFTRITRLVNLDTLPNPDISWSPDGNLLLLRGIDSNPQRNNLWVYRLATGELTQLTSTGGVVAASFNPTSDKVVYDTVLSSSTQRSVVTLTDLSSSQLPLEGAGSAIAWKDSGSFFSPSSGGSLNLVTLQGAVTTFPITIPTQEEITSLTYVSSLKRLVFATPTAVYSIDLESN